MTVSRMPVADLTIRSSSRASPFSENKASSKRRWISEAARRFPIAPSLPTRSPTTGRGFNESARHWSSNHLLSGRASSPSARWIKLKGSPGASPRPSDVGAQPPSKPIEVSLPSRTIADWGKRAAVCLIKADPSHSARSFAVARMLRALRRARSAAPPNRSPSITSGVGVISRRS